MIGYWISFALILLLVPIGLASFIAWFERKHSCSDAQKKNARINMMVYWLFYWLCDFFYMACFIDNLICKYIFGVIILCVIFINFLISFSSIKNKESYERAGMIQGFFVGIGLTVYLIYLIPDSSVQVIVTAIVSAIYGGLITLAGVAWTIRKSDLDRKNDEIKKAKPLFSFNPQLREGSIDGSAKACFTDIDYKNGFTCEAHVEIENSINSSFSFNRIYHDGKWYGLVGNKTVLPSGKCYLVFDFSSPFDIVLSVKDSLGQEYFYLLKVIAMPPISAPDGSFTYNNKIFHTLREIEEISKKRFDEMIMSSAEGGSKNGTE